MTQQLHLGMSAEFQAQVHQRMHQMLLDQSEDTMYQPPAEYHVIIPVEHRGHPRRRVTA